ncbi:MAG TPA: CPBP family intramembrane glutamic endopeptidase [Polyangiaceae bacterium]|jgi:hypothetical protein
MDGDEDSSPPRGTQPMTLLAGLAWTLLLAFLEQLVVQGTESLRPGAITDLVSLTASVVLAYSVILFAMLRVHAPNASIRDVLGVRAVSPWGALLAFVGGLALAPGKDLLDDVMEKRFPIPAEDAELLEKLLHATTFGERAALLIAVVVAFPLCEDFFFRGALFRGLRRGQTEGGAVLASAVLCAVSLAGAVRGLPAAFLVGLFTAWLRGRSGSVLPAILAHVALEAVSGVPLALGKAEFDLAPKLVVGGAVLAGLCVWGASVVFSRDPRAAKARRLDSAQGAPG